MGDLQAHVRFVWGLCGIVVNNGHNRKETIIKNKK